MKSIAIVGANSYIARNLTHYILKNRSDISLFLYDREENHKDGFHTYTSVNILDKKSLESVNTEVDALILFVGKTGTMAGFDDYETFVDVNEKGLLNVLDLLRNRNSKAKLVFPSTRLVYKGMNHPLKEDSEKEFKTIYAANKFSCENYLAMYRNAFEINYAVFRICVPYGTLIEGVSSYGTCEMFLGKALKKEEITLYGDGSVRRTLTHIEDLCEILTDGSLSPNCVNDIYNIGGEDYSLKEMADLLAKKYGINVSSIEWPKAALSIESGSTVFDSTKLEKALGYATKKKFSEWILC